MKELLKKIEEEREQLNKLFEDKGSLSDPEILTKSSQLDNLIVQALKKWNEVNADRTIN